MEISNVRTLYCLLCVSSFVTAAQYYHDDAVVEDVEALFGGIGSSVEPVPESAPKRLAPRELFPSDEVPNRESSEADNQEVALIVQELKQVGPQVTFPLVESGKARAKRQKADRATLLDFLDRVAKMISFNPQQAQEELEDFVAINRDDVQTVPNGQLVPGASGSLGRGHRKRTSKERYNG